MVYNLYNLLFTYKTITREILILSLKIPFDIPKFIHWVLDKEIILIILGVIVLSPHNFIIHGVLTSKDFAE